MSNAHMIVSEESWRGMPEEDRAWLMFNTLQAVDQRVTKLEKRKWLDKSLTFGGGALGGFLAYLGINLK